MTYCKRCKGTGQILAQLRPEQDYAYAERGMPIPKVDCPTCNGSGQERATDGEVVHKDNAK